MDTVNWPTVSGKKHTMELYVIGTSFKTNPGVYIFCKPAANNTWMQIYVGECEDFNDRLNVNLEQHHRWECIKRSGATHMCVMQVAGGKLSRTAIETDLRQQLDPPCNRQ